MANVRRTFDVCVVASETGQRYWFSFKATGKQHAKRLGRALMTSLYPDMTVAYVEVWRNGKMWSGPPLRKVTAAGRRIRQPGENDAEIATAG